MIIDKEPQHLTVNDISWWLKARRRQLSERAQHLMFDHSKAVDQRELVQIEQMLQHLQTLADACVSGSLPLGLEDLVHDEAYEREEHLMHGQLAKDLAQSEQEERP